MKFAEKEFSYYWKIIQIPVYILVGWNLLGFIVGLISYTMYSSIFQPLASWILIFAVFGFIGWTTLKDHKGNIANAAWAGGLCGAISGVAGAIIGILMFYLVPDVILNSVQLVSQKGIDKEMMMAFMKIGIYVSLITTPLIYGAFGAAISAIVGLFANKK